MTLQQTQSATPVAPRSARARRRPLILGEVVVVMVLLKVYDHVRGFAHLQEHSAERHAIDILSLERVLHLNGEHSANAWFAVHARLSMAAAYWYQFMHVGMTLAVLACCYLFVPSVYRSARNSLVLTNCAGMAVYLLLPVMPPRLLPHPHFIDVMGAAGFDHTSMSHVTEDQFAAMPSLHMAWAAWTAVVLFVMLRRFRWSPVVFVYPVVTAVVVVGTANHYTLDLVAGLAVTMASAALAGLFAHSGERVDAPVNHLSSRRAAGMVSVRGWRM